MLNGRVTAEEATQRRGEKSSGWAFLCQVCQGPTCVLDSRPTEQGIRRRRKCLDCGFRFTTYEHAEVRDSVKAMLWQGSGI